MTEIAFTFEQVVTVSAVGLFFTGSFLRASYDRRGMRDENRTAWGEIKGILGSIAKRDEQADSRYSRWREEQESFLNSLREINRSFIEQTGELKELRKETVARLEQIRLEQSTEHQKIVSVLDKIAEKVS